MAVQEGATQNSAPVKSGNSTSTGAGVTTEDEEPLNLSLIMSYSDNFTVKLVFAAVIVALIAPAFFGQSASESGSVSEDRFGNLGPNAILDGIKSDYLLPVSLDRVLLLDAGSNEDWDEVPRLLRRDSSKEFVLGIVDMANTKSVQDAEALASTIHDGIASIGDIIGKDKILIATDANGDVYNGFDTVLDEYLGVDRTLHALGDGKHTDEVQTAAAKCFTDAVQCARVIDGATGKENSLNAKVRRAMLSLYLEAKSRCGLGASKKHLGSSTSEDISASVKVAPPLKVKKEIAEDPEDYEDEYETAPVEGPGFVKLFFLWLTRVLGFIYPLAQTRQALISRREELGAWRAYWTLFAAIHTIEDLLFVNLVYLMPVYMIVKMGFLGWCVIPEPDNALLVYNMIIELIRPTPKPKAD